MYTAGAHRSWLEVCSIDRSRTSGFSSTASATDHRGRAIETRDASYFAATGDNVNGPSVNYGGTHGYSSADPELDGIFIAQGAGIKRGVKLERVRNLDVAPTIARLLGVELPGADGRPMEGIFTR